jgi:DNA processing protein
MRLPVLPGPEAPQRPLKEVALLHSMILSRLGPSPLAEDQLLRDLAVSPAQLAPELLTLELEGRIARQPGGLLSRID